MRLRNTRRRPPLAIAALVATIVFAGIAVPGAAQTPSVATVRVLDEPVQTITGFGASGAWWPNDAIGFAPAVQARIGQMLFDRTSGLGLSIYRYNIGGGGTGVRPGPRAVQSFMTAPGSYDWSDDPGGTAFLRLAYHYGVHRLIGFANSAPRFFTSNSANCGGSLDAAGAGRYAGYLATVVSHLRAAYGIRLAAVSPMNEPSHSFPDCDQEGMIVPPSRRAGVIAALSKALAGTAPGTAVSVDESTTAGALRAGISGWIGARVGSVAFHGYDYPTVSALRSLHATVRSLTAAQLEMSEVCCSTGSAFTRGYNPGMIGGLWLADTIWRDLSAGRVNSFSWWTALSPKLGCDPATDASCATSANAHGWNDGLLYYDPDFRTDGNQAVYPTSRYWVLGNFSRYIRPGAVHYRVTGVPSGVHAIAFRRNTWRVVLINDSDAGRPIGVRLLPPPAGRSYGTPSAVTTTATAGLAASPVPALDSATSTVTTSLPPRSVTTLVVPW